MRGCEGGKAPELDEFNMDFVKSHWSLLKGVVMRIFDELFESGSFDKGFKASFITLIPKVPNLSSLNEYRPIGLVGCVYKVIAKMLSKRLGA